MPQCAVRRCSYAASSGRKTCDRCRTKLTADQRRRIDNGFDVNIILSTIVPDSSSYGGDSYGSSSSYDSGSSGSSSSSDGGGGGGCD